MRDKMKLSGAVAAFLLLAVILSDFNCQRSAEERSEGTDQKGAILEGETPKAMQVPELKEYTLAGFCILCNKPTQKIVKSYSPPDSAMVLVACNDCRVNRFESLSRELVNVLDCDFEASYREQAYEILKELGTKGLKAIEVNGSALTNKRQDRCLLDYAYRAFLDDTSEFSTGWLPYLLASVQSGVSGNPRADLETRYKILAEIERRGNKDDLAELARAVTQDSRGHYDFRFRLAVLKVVDQWADESDKDALAKSGKELINAFVDFKKAPPGEYENLILRWLAFMKRFSGYEVDKMYLKFAEEGFLSNEIRVLAIERLAKAEKTDEIVPFLKVASMKSDNKEVAEASRKTLAELLARAE